MHPSKLLKKAPIGISGFDEITGGGVPAGRPTLVCGGAGCGKSLFAAEFLVRGALQFNEPGVLMTFEETALGLSISRMLVKMHEGTIFAQSASVGHGATFTIQLPCADGRHQ